MQFWPILKGAATWVPFLYDAERGQTGGTASARYCYSVWMRHLISAASCGFDLQYRSVAELGPGDSLGIGLAALICGGEKLHALDVVHYASSAGNQVVLDDLVELFRNRAPIPAADEFPGVFPILADYSFPHSLWPRGQLDDLLHQDRLEAILAALRGRPRGPIEVGYAVPWQALPPRAHRSVDIALSQAVLEHVDDLAGTYAALRQWLAPGAFMSHVIDFRSHCITPGWDGHLQYPPSMWRVVRGRRPYLLNRRGPADHLRLMRQAGFEILRVTRQESLPTVPAMALAPEFQGLSDEDRRTSSMHVIARAPFAQAQDGQ